MKRLVCFCTMILILLTFTVSALGQDDLSKHVTTESSDEQKKVILQRLKMLEEEVIRQAKIVQELKEEIAKQNNPGTQKTEQKLQPTDQGLKQKVEELDNKVQQVADAQKKEVISVFNPSIGLVGESILSYSTKGSNETGNNRPGGWDFFQRSTELNIAASVDPFVKAYAVFNASADAQTGNASVNVEEAAVQTTSLPGNLTLKAGRFFGEFGRLSYIHDHELPFVNRPLTLDQYMGGESQTNGLQINWLAPVEHYVSLTLGSGIQFGGDNPPNNVGTFRELSGLNYWGRLSSYFDLTPDISFEPGISGLWNPSTNGQWSNPGGINPSFPTDINNNTFTERERRLYGVDFMLSYKPLQKNQFQSLVWGTEILYSDNRYDVTAASGNALPGTSVNSLGLYSYLTYKFHRQWSAGLLFGRTENIINNQDVTYNYSPYITWAISHWNQLRLQYTHTDHNAASTLTSDDAFYLQWCWIIGAHSHGWQER